MGARTQAFGCFASFSPDCSALRIQRWIAWRDAHAWQGRKKTDNIVCPFPFVERSSFLIWFNAAPADKIRGYIFRKAEAWQ